MELVDYFFCFLYHIASIINYQCSFFEYEILKKEIGVVLLCWTIVSNFITFKKIKFPFLGVSKVKSTFAVFSDTYAINVRIEVSWKDA